MAVRRASEICTEFDRQFVANLLQLPSSNTQRLEIVRRALQKAIQTDLTPRQREIMLLRYYEQKRGWEIAKILGIHPSTVSRTRKRGEERLRKSLQFYMDFLNCSLEDDE